MNIQKELDRAWELHRAGRLAEAEQVYRAILGVDPNQPDALQMLGQVAFAAGRLDAAIELFGRSLAQDPGQARVLVNLGVACREARRDQDAIAAFERALRLEPGLFEARLHLAVALLTEGETGQAESHLRRAIADRPDFAEAYRMLTLATRLGPDEPLVAAMEGLLEKADIAPEDAAHLHFALGKSHRDLGHDAEFIAHIVAANRLQRAGAGRDVGYYQVLFERIRAAFTRAPPVAARRHDPASPTPIFIVGMPRSGTTLVEQILASHGRVFGGDEVTFFYKDVIDALTRRTGQPYPRGLDALGQDDVTALGNLYLGKLRALAPGAEYVSDKYVANFQHIGLIRMLLPGARVIHLARDAMDTCFSIFTNYFPGDETFHCGLGDLGAFYRLYRGLMDHWRAVTPDFFLTVDYESLIADQEAETRRLLDFCGLEWDPACLDFHTTRRRIRTNSWTQVRRPLYRTSIGAWKPFERELGPLIEALKGQ